MTAMLCCSMRSLRLERRLRHLDAERLRLVAARDDAAVVRRQDHGGTAFEGWTGRPARRRRRSYCNRPVRRCSWQAPHHPGDDAPDVGLLAIEGGERTGGQLALDYRDDDGTRAWRT